MGAYLAYTDAEYSFRSKPIIDRLRQWLPRSLDANCLDVACGAGQLLYALRQHGYRQLTGIDLSPEQVKVASKVCVNVKQGDAIEFLRASPAMFDLITGFDIVEHFRKDELFEFLDALYCALKPGGRLILQTPNAESPWGMTMRYGDLTHELAFSPMSLEYALRLAAFSDFQAKECGPYVHGIKSLLRAFLWRMISAGLKVWNLAETGNTGSGIYTRVFIAKADKKAA